MIDNIESLAFALNNRPKHDQRLEKRRGTVITLSVLLMIIMIIGLMAPSLLFIALAGFVVFILMVPLLHTPEIDWFAPWSFVLYSGFVEIGRASCRERV